jgi:NADPH:quinone reductase-like Zn-dependent oxidoreductase
LFSDKSVSNYLLVGDKVCGMLPLMQTSWGAAAEYVAVDEKQLALIPRHMDFTAVAGIPTVALTVLQAMDPYVKAQYAARPVEGLAGQKILIHGGSGGVGESSAAMGGGITLTS